MARKRTISTSSEVGAGVAPAPVRTVAQGVLAMTAVMVIMARSVARGTA